MQPKDRLKLARLEQLAAQQAFKRMEDAQSMEQLDMEWRNLLNALEKLWVKTERACQHVRNTFQPWQGIYAQKRKNDMLLRYLLQARHADNHSIEDVSHLREGHLAIRSATDTGRSYIKTLVVKNGRVVNYEGDPLEYKVVLPKPVALPVKNQGVRFEVPTHHLNNPLQSQHPLELAKLGLSFYSDYLDAVDAKFFPGNAI